MHMEQTIREDDPAGWAYLFRPVDLIFKPLGPEGWKGQSFSPKTLVKIGGLFPPFSGFRKVLPALWLGKC